MELGAGAAGDSNPSGRIHSSALAAAKHILASVLEQHMTA